MNSILDMRKVKMSGAPGSIIRKFRITRSFFGYLTSAVLMLLFFLYLRFPGDAVRNYLKADVGARYPEIVFVMDSVGPVIPPGMKLENLSLVFRGRPEATLHADSLAFFPGWGSLFKGRAGIAVSASLYGGEINGSGGLENPFALDGPYAATARFDEIRLDKCLMLQSLFERRISGTLRGSLSAKGTAGTVKNMTWQLAATITNGSYQLLENLAGFDKINFSRIDMKMEMRNGVLKVSNVTVNGDKLRITLNGNILLDADLKESRIDLAGSVELQGLGGRRMPITIGGVIGMPTMKLM